MMRRAFLVTALLMSGCLGSSGGKTQGQGQCSGSSCATGTGGNGNGSDGGAGVDLGSDGSGGSGSGGSGGGNDGNGNGGSGGSGGGCNGCDMAGSTDAPPPALRGATVPYWEYEAEAATTTGTKLGPSRNFGDVANEASNRMAVQLGATGQNVSFTLAHAANSIVVRYAIPDAFPSSGSDPQPATPTSSLGVYVNGARVASLTMTSRYSWTYGDADAQDVGSNAPGNGQAHHYFDEAHVMFASVPAGTTIALQKDAQDSAAYYVIDLVDFENVPAPLTQPAGSLSLTDFGAVPDDGNDDGPALQNAINAAEAQNKVLWIPKGVFNLDFASVTTVGNRNVVIGKSGVTIRGAGMWYSTLSGFGAQFKMNGGTNDFSDFAVFGDVTYRSDTTGYQGFDGPWGTNSKITSVWIEHTNVGMWVGHGATLPPINAPLTSALTVHGMRIRDTWADGVNLANATANSTVEQSTFRNTGDDSVATWSYGTEPPGNEKVWQQVYPGVTNRAMAE